MIVNRMPVADALAVLADCRTREIVVTTMGATREWSRLSESPLDLHYLPSAMGHAPMIALGIALAQPQREVIVLNGDGSQLMSLGCLVTIVASGVSNLSVLLLDNGVYEVTGGQRTAGSLAEVDFPTIARGAGFATVASFDALAEWRSDAMRLLQARGPRFLALKVAPVRQDFVPKLQSPLPDRLARFRQAISSKSSHHAPPS